MKTNSAARFFLRDKQRRPFLKERSAFAIDKRDDLLHALETGDVVFVYGSRALEPALRAVQEDVAGPFDPAVAAAGQAVILDYRPHTAGVVALAWRRLLRVRGPDDPQLHAFADAWLGKGASR